MRFSVARPLSDIGTFKENLQTEDLYKFVIVYGKEGGEGDGGHRNKIK